MHQVGNLSATMERANVPRESSLSQSSATALGLRLRQLRESNGQTQEMVANLAGLNRNHYQLLESGLSSRTAQTTANPRLSTMLDIANALNCPIIELLDALPLSTTTGGTVQTQSRSQRIN